MYAILSLLLICPLFSQGQPVTGKVMVEVTNLQPRQGTVTISVYNSKDGFPSDADKAIKRVDVKVTAVACLAEINLPPGIYALSVAHDVNDNKEIDTNFFGIPKEPLGMSNYSEMAKPKFEKAKFHLRQGDTVRLVIPLNTIF